MGDRIVRLFSVRCRCGAELMTVPLLGSTELLQCQEHLRDCLHDDPLPDCPPLREIIRRLRITVVSPGSEAPPRLH